MKTFGLPLVNIENGDSACIRVVDNACRRAETLKLKEFCITHVLFENIRELAANYVKSKSVSNGRGFGRFTHKLRYYNGDFNVDIDSVSESWCAGYSDVNDVTALTKCAKS